MSVGVPNSLNQTALFVTRAPDWGLTVELDLVHQTNLFVARSGKEQRTRTVARAKARITYTQRGLTQAEANQANTRAKGEVRAPLWVPFWTEGAVVVQVPSPGLVTINVLPSPDFFAVGQKLFVGGEFIAITAVADQVLTLATTPAVSPLNATVYPARFCRRVMGSDTLKKQSGRTHGETLIYETID